MVAKNLNEIFELEYSENFNDAFSEYQKLILENKDDFRTWKFYFFFLWSMLEDLNGRFTTKIDLQTELKKELKNGIKTHSNLAEFNFIAGYAISIFPYEFGVYENMEKKGFEMLKKAYNMEPNNSIYKMVFLGSKEQTGKTLTEYKIACEKSEQIVRELYKDKGLMNKYFTEVLIRTEKPTGNNG